MRAFFVLFFVHIFCAQTWASEDFFDAYNPTPVNHKIAVIGTGYVGLVAGACLADFGHEVICCDIDVRKIETLNQGHIPIYEYGLEKLVEKNRREGRLVFSSGVKEAIEQCDVIMVCVGTPSDDEGKADLRAMFSVAHLIGKNLNKPKIVFVKSTVPPGTVYRVAEIIRENNRNGVNVDVAFIPEFLREGTSVEDFFKPDRVVIGAESDATKKLFCEIFYPIYFQKVPFVFTSIISAELIKYASNSFLAVKLSFINEMANLCDCVGADILDVAKGMGLDSRIGLNYLKPGPGYGGSCLPKDTQAIIQVAKSNNVSLKVVQAAVEVNSGQIGVIVRKLEKILGPVVGKRVAVLGLAFKSNTDDIRYSPSLAVIEALRKKGANVIAYDPVAMSNTKRAHSEIECVDSAYEAVIDADAVLLMTDWNEFLELDWDRIRQLMRGGVLIDTRNMLSGEIQGFEYDQMGRGVGHP